MYFIVVFLVYIEPECGNADTSSTAVHEGAALPVENAASTTPQSLDLVVQDDKVLRAALPVKKSISTSKKPAAVTQGEVLREQFNALKAKQENQVLKKRKLELEILYLQKKLGKEN